MKGLSKYNATGHAIRIREIATYYLMGAFFLFCIVFILWITLK